MPPLLGLGIVPAGGPLGWVLYDTRNHDGSGSLLNEGEDPNGVFDGVFTTQFPASYSGLPDVGDVYRLRGRKSAVSPTEGSPPYIAGWDDIGGTPDDAAIVCGMYYPSGVNTHPINGTFDIDVNTASGSTSGFSCGGSVDYQATSIFPLANSIVDINLDAGDWTVSFNALNWFRDSGDTTVQDLSDTFVAVVIDVTTDYFEAWIDDGTSQSTYNYTQTGSGTTFVGSPNYFIAGKSAGANALKGAWPGFTTTQQRRSNLTSVGDATVPGTGTPWAAVTGAILARPNISEVTSSYIRDWWSYFN